MTNIPFYSNSIPIVFSADENYIPYMSVTIQSIMENSDQNKNYVFYVLHKGITDKTLDIFIKQIALFTQFSIEFIDVTPYISRYKFFISNHITVEAYFRLLIPELLTEYSKVIYLDCDMIICTDIAELFNINIESYLLAAVRDIPLVIRLYNNKEMSKDMKNSCHILLNLKEPSKYFNSGLCVFNIELFRKTISSEKLLEIAASQNWNFHDQDVLNYIGEGKVLLLPFHWNLMTTPDTEYLPDYLRHEYIDAEKNPKIIHYKPWISNKYILHFELFWKYATHTPFIDIIIERMKAKDFFSFYNESFDQNIILNIKHRKGISLKFILIDCVKAWLFRDKLKK